MKSTARAVLFLAMCLTAGLGRAELTIEITQGTEGALPIAVVPFGTAVPVREDVADIVAANLERSGRFDPLSPGQFVNRPATLGQVDFPAWQALQVNHLVVGEVRPSATGGLLVQFQLADVFQGTELLSLVFDVKPEELRKVAHHISDAIYEALTGERGAFNTRIAYVSATRSGTDTQYELMVADSDGHNPMVVLRSEQPVMSPAWSPDGSVLAYVSFEGRRAQIVAQDLYSGTRTTLTEFPGINGAPAWSPDGRSLAFTLSKDGNPEIYVLDVTSRTTRRLTSNSAIDTEPAWSPDGRSLVFTSDRGGSPQLYRVGLDGARPERISFRGEYNAAAAFSPDGRMLALVHRERGRFHIATLDLGTRELKVLTEGGLDESPSFAPNGRIIIYATSQGPRGVLEAVSADGSARQRLVSRDSDVRDPAWGPYNR